MSGDSSSDDDDYLNVQRPFHIVYNWSMTGGATEVAPFCKKINYASVKFKPDIQVTVAPPSPYLSLMRKLLKKRIGVCSQNCCHEEVGAFTGEVSAPMLRNVKATGVICGHWEKRRRSGEDPGVVALQVQRATESRLIAFLCFGESMEERESTRTMSVIRSQISALFELPIDWKKVVLVYQPVWAFKDENLVACEVQFPAEEEQDEPDGDDKEAPPNDDGQVEIDEVFEEQFDDEKYTVIIPPKSQHVDDLMGQVRRWLTRDASKRIAWTTPILYGEHVAAEEGPDFARMQNIDGLFVERKSLILDEIADEDVENLKEEGDFEDFIQLVRRCGEDRQEDENLNEITFDLGMKKKIRKKGKK